MLKTSSVSFGKVPVLNCTIKEKNTNSKNSATLYLMDYKDIQDRQSIQYSRHTGAIKRDFLSYNKPPLGKKFYVLKNDKTGEVISCLETEVRMDRENLRTYTVIDEMEENEKYVDSITPSIGYVTKEAYERGDKEIKTAFLGYDNFDMKKYKFSETKLGNMILPERRYNTLIEIAENRNQIEYIA